MKILIVRTFPSILDPKHYNIQEIGLAKALTRAGNECGIVLYNGSNPDTTETIPVKCDFGICNITIYKLHGYNLLKNGIFPSLNKIVKNYDIIQVHEYDQLTSWFYYAWSKKRVVIYHGPYYDSFNKGYNLKCKVFDNIFLRIKHNKNRVCFTKSYVAAEFLKNKGFLRSIPVGVGLDVENFNLNYDVRNNELKGKENKINILYVGKIEERRNSLFLIDILRKLCDEREDINCIIVGTGEKEYLNNFLEKANILISSDRMQYYPKASQYELAELYRSTQLMLFPTNYDIFGMVLLEAIYYRLPIVSSFNGAADMLINDGINGKIVYSNDVNVWYSEIISILEPDNYKKIKQNLESMNTEICTWDHIASLMMKEYEANV